MTDQDGSRDGVRSTTPRSTARLVAYFVIAVIVLAALGSLLLPSEEPPIKVRGGSLDIIICSNSASGTMAENEMESQLKRQYSKNMSSRSL